MPFALSAPFRPIAALALLGMAAWLSGCSSSDVGGSMGPTGGASAASGGNSPASGGASGQTATGGASAGGTAGGVGAGQAGSVSAGSGGSAAGGQGGSDAGGSGQGGAAQGGAAGGAAAGNAAVAGTAGLAGTGGAAAGSGGGPSSSSTIQALRDYLAIERAARPPLLDQPFASVALTAAEAEEARTLLWEDYAALIRETRQAETDAKAISIGANTLRYDFTTFGDMPAGGRSLYLSLHGGGEAEASVNDEQWENQKGLYQPDEGIYLAPRAPTNTWNLWHEAHIDPLFERLITNLIVLENVNPNRVYVMGYSAGGDGVYQLGPRMADHWAAAAMMAGHPNDAEPDSLRNIGFTIHVGGLDTAFDRNLVAEEWGTLLDGLMAQDPAGYAHLVQVHPDKPHWMDLEDAVAVPWMAAFTRDPVPDRVVWLQDDVPHERSYWLAVDAPGAGDRIVASYAGQTITVESADVDSLKLRLSDQMLDLDQPLTVSADGATVFTGSVERTIATLFTTLEERGDPALVFAAEVAIDL